MRQTLNLEEAIDYINELEAAIRRHHDNVAKLGLGNHGQGNYAWGGPFDWELWKVLDLPIHPEGREGS